MRTRRKDGKMKSIRQAKREERNRILKLIDWYYNDLQKQIDKTHETERYEISDGEMAKIIMEKAQFLLKEIKQKIK